MEFFSDDHERAQLYKLLSSLFLQEPTDELLTQIKDLFGMTFDDAPYEIGIDFIYLFSDHRGHLPPYESLYNYPVWDTSRLWGRSTHEVQKFYTSAGLVIDEEIDIIPDHLSAELLFMSYLIENNLTEHQKRFLKEHLLAWVPGYCDEVKKYARTHFYKSVAVLLKELIVIEGEEFGIKGGE